MYNFDYSVVLAVLVAVLDQRSSWKEISGFNDVVLFCLVDYFCILLEGMVKTGGPRN